MCNRFGKVLGYYRTVAGFGLRETARLTGLSPAYLSQLETGERPPPTPQVIHLLAKVLRVPRKKLYFAAGRMTPKAQAIAKAYPEGASVALERQEPIFKLTKEGRGNGQGGH